jgi:uncharacterized protein
MKKIVQIGALAAALATALALAGVGRPDLASGSSGESRAVTVTGTATVQTVPDRAVFTFGVGTTAATARAAVAENAAKAQRVVAALRGKGVAPGDLRTQDVSVSPHWNDDGRQDGYAAHASVEARVRAVGRAGPVLDAAVAAGATETSGPVFERSGRQDVYRSALRRAFGDARAKAKALATEAGTSLGHVLRMEEGALSEPPRPYLERAALAAETPVEPGTQEVDARLTVTFSLA